MNFCILMPFCFIYMQTLFHNNRDLYAFLVEVKFKLQIGYCICLNNSSLTKSEKDMFVFDTL